MESRKEIVLKMVSLGMTTHKALSIADIPRSTYYYKSTGTKKGKRPSGYTIYRGNMVTDSVVVSSMKDILGQDFIDYGYIRTTEELKNNGYHINKKKVYRLMKENGLLNPNRISKARGLSKDFVKYSSPICTHPFELMEIDVKYIHINGLNRNAYLITILDVFTKQALEWTLNWDMKTNRVTMLLNDLYLNWLIPYKVDPHKIQVKVRTDNGSQFIATMFRNHLDSAGIKNEYIRPGTPQQNGHIESFHNTVSKLVCKKYWFENLDEADQALKKFYGVYNNKRIMKSIKYKTPSAFFKLWLEHRIEIKTVNKKINYLIREKKPEYQASPSSDFLAMHDKYIDKLNKCLTFY